jgi:cytochrome P450
MSGIVYSLNKYPDQRALLESDPSIIPSAASEFIRWQTPLAHMRRTATEDAVLEGKEIKKGEKVILWYISGNRDESVFPDAERLILNRENARRHLSFGYGIHRCVGARLAELQVQILLEEMAKRRMRVTVLDEPVRVSQSFVNGYRKMDVELSKY